MTKRKLKRRSKADLLGDDPDEPAPSSRKPGRPIADHRQKLVLEQAEHARLKNQALRGELVPRTAVVAEWSAILRELRAAILAAPSRIRSKLPHLTQHDCATIDEVLRAILADLAADSGAKAPGVTVQADS